MQAGRSLRRSSASSSNLRPKTVSQWPHAQDYNDSGYSSRTMLASDESDESDSGSEDESRFSSMQQWDNRLSFYGWGQSGDQSMSSPSSSSWSTLQGTDPQWKGRGSTIKSISSDDLFPVKLDDAKRDSGGSYDGIVEDAIPGIVVKAKMILPPAVLKDTPYNEVSTSFSSPMSSFYTPTQLEVIDEDIKGETSAEEEFVTSRSGESLSWAQHLDELLDQSAASGQDVVTQVGVPAALSLPDHQASGQNHSVDRRSDLFASSASTVPSRGMSNFSYPLGHTPASTYQELMTPVKTLENTFQMFQFDDEVSETGGEVQRGPSRFSDITPTTVSKPTCFGSAMRSRLKIDKFDRLISATGRKLMSSTTFTRTRDALSTMKSKFSHVRSRYVPSARRKKKRKSLWRSSASDRENADDPTGEYTRSNQTRVPADGSSLSDNSPFGANQGNRTDIPRRPDDLVQRTRPGPDYLDDPHRDNVASPFGRRSPGIESSPSTESLSALSFIANTSTEDFTVRYGDTPVRQPVYSTSQYTFPEHMTTITYDSRHSWRDNTPQISETSEPSWILPSNSGYRTFSDALRQSQVDRDKELKSVDDMFAAQGRYLRRVMDEDEEEEVVVDPELAYLSSSIL